MRVALQQINLAAIIARGAAVAPKTSPMPILSMVRLTATDGRLAVASTDMDRFAEAEGAARVDGAGSACVEASALATLIGKHPKNAEVLMEVVDGRLVVSCGRSKVKLPTLPSDGFPTWADEEPEAVFSLNGDDFERAFNRVRFAASTNISQVNMQGVHLDASEGVLHFVACDGHRLAVSGMAVPEGAAECPKVIVPSEAVDAALKVFKGAPRVDVTVTQRAIGMAADGLRLVSRLIDGTFPDYSRVIPARGNPAMTVRRADFVDCLDRANVLTGEGAFSAIVARPAAETLRLESANQKGGEAREELPATIDDGFKPFGFNPRYAAQFLSTLSVGDITIEQANPDAAHLLYSADAPDFIGILMPMRVQSGMSA